MEEGVGRGWNIKCFDKIKLTSISTGCRVHSNSFGYKSKSYNTALTCHKVRDETDWYATLLTASGSSCSGRRNSPCPITFATATSSSSAT